MGLGSRRCAAPFARRPGFAKPSGSKIHHHFPNQSRRISTRGEKINHPSPAKPPPSHASPNMNAAQTGVENLDLEKLNDKDKAELRQFLANEQQRSQIQSRESNAMLLPAWPTRYLPSSGD